MTPSTKLGFFLPYTLLLLAMPGQAKKPEEQLAASIEATQPNGLYGTLCGIPALTGC